MLGKFDANTQLNVIEEGVQAGLITLTRLGEDVEHSVEPCGVDTADKEIVAQRLELVEQPLPAPNGPASAFERIAHRLQRQQPLDAGNAGGHGGRGGPASCGRAADDEICPR